MGNLTNMNFTDIDPRGMSAELEKLRAFRAAVAAEIPRLMARTSPPLTVAYPLTSESIRRIIDAFRAAE